MNMDGITFGRGGDVRIEVRQNDAHTALYVNGVQLCGVEDDDKQNTVFIWDIQPDVIQFKMSPAMSMIAECRRCADRLNELAAENKALREQLQSDIPGLSRGPGCYYADANMRARGRDCICPGCGAPISGAWSYSCGATWTRQPDHGFRLICPVEEARSDANTPQDRDEDSARPETSGEAPPADDSQG